MNWLCFLRHYRPIARNDNMYDETIQRSARRRGIAPIEFRASDAGSGSAVFRYRTIDPVSVILTGTAGDGKTHLCRQVWAALGGNRDDWGSDSAYLTMQHRYPGIQKEVKLHFIRDLSGWAPQQGAEWEYEKEQLLQTVLRLPVHT